MENIKILIDDVQKDVYGLVYIYDSKYYFIYTEKEVDGEYVVLYMTQVGKETQNTPTGPVDTGYMIGVEVTNPEEQKKAQTSISYIVEDKKNNTTNSQIQYLPISMLTNLKIISKKRFRLLKSIMVDNFKLTFDTIENKELETVVSPEPIEENVSPLQQEIGVDEELNNNQSIITNNENDNVIVDYRTRYFEEEEKNKELQSQIDFLTQKLEEIKKIIE